MTDYERRLQRVEELDRGLEDDDELGELIRKRCDELLASPEMLAWMRDNQEAEVPAEEWAAQWEAIQVAAGVRPAGVRPNR